MDVKVIECKIDNPQGKGWGNQIGESELWHYSGRQVAWLIGHVWCFCCSQW